MDEHACDPQPQPPQATLPPQPWDCPVCGQGWRLKDQKRIAVFNSNNPGAPTWRGWEWRWIRWEDRLAQ